IRFRHVLLALIISPLSSLSYFFFSCCGHHLYLHSFPTRRSSDLLSTVRWRPPSRCLWRASRRSSSSGWEERTPSKLIALMGQLRSEEHTSELQSRSDLVCRLLLEKKKIKETGMSTLQTKLPMDKV